MTLEEATERWRALSPSARGDVLIDLLTLAEEAEEWVGDTGSLTMSKEIAEARRAAFELLEAAAKKGSSYPQCKTCGHGVLHHVVDDEERRECTACDCQQFLTVKP